MKDPILITLFILALIPTGYAQNIVPNHSFEVADSCPTGLNNRTYKYSLGCVGWGQATTATSDYYNACDTAALSIGQLYPIAGIPHNIWGYQNAHDGSAYAGIYMYHAGIPFYKEYLIATIPPLLKDTAYKVTIYVSLADSSRYACDAMGVLFTTYGSPNQSSGSAFTIAPQINYTNYGVISDTTHWIKLSSVFVADSAYNNIIIGGFKNSSEMNKVDFNSAHKTTVNASYYYIDNVIVEKASSTRVFEMNNKSIDVYPNPFTDYAILLVDNSNNNEHTLVLFNAMGKAVQKIESSADRIRIERHDLPAGFYHYQLYSKDGLEGNGKLIIK